MSVRYFDVFQLLKLTLCSKVLVVLQKLIAAKKFLAKKFLDFYKPKG